jgi:hypothetical protein
MDSLGCKAIVAERPQSAYTPAMTLNKAAFLALVGMIPGDDSARGDSSATFSALCEV